MARQELDDLDSKRWKLGEMAVQERIRANAYRLEHEKKRILREREIEKAERAKTPAPSNHGFHAQVAHWVERFRDAVIKAPAAWPRRRIGKRARG